MADQERKPKMSVWTEFQVSGSDELGGEKWVRVLEPLVQASGHRKSVWSRISERPEYVLLVTLWESRTAFEDFQASSNYSIFWEGISSVSHPKTQPIEGQGSLYWFKFLQPAVQVFKVYFPTSLSEDQNRAIAKLHGLLPPALGFSARPDSIAQVATPEKIWPLGEEVQNGRVVKVIWWLHFWKTAEKEAAYKQRTTHIMKTGGPPGLFTMMEEFEMKLRNAGAISWTEEHYDFEPVPRRE